MLCFVLINRVLFNLLCVWILFFLVSASTSPNMIFVVVAAAVEKATFYVAVFNMY